MKADGAQDHHPLPPPAHTGKGRGQEPHLDRQACTKGPKINPQPLPSRGISGARAGKGFALPEAWESCRLLGQTIPEGAALAQQQGGYALHAVGCRIRPQGKGLR